MRLYCKCCSCFVKTVIPSFTKCQWWKKRILAHHLHPLGSSIQVSLSLFCTNHSRTVSHPGPALVTKVSILFSSFLSQGQKYKTKNGATYSTKYPTQGPVPRKQQKVLYLSQRLLGFFKKFKSWQLSWCVLMNQICLQNKSLLRSFVYFEE